jgi:trk system potassium uptake protein TrkH
VACPAKIGTNYQAKAFSPHELYRIIKINYILMKILNFRLVFHTLGIVLLCESLFMLLSLSITFIYQTDNFFPFITSFIITASTGGLLILLANRKKSLKDATIRDSFLIVCLSWLSISILGTLPYLLSGEIPFFVDAYFESVSGFTTTGSSILTDVELISKDILFWRSETHWIGGMGIIVLVVAILPFFNVGGNRLFSSEGSKVSFEKIKPKVIDTAKRLWLIYMVLTVAEIILLTVFGMDLFDSVCHSFGTIATGGFSTKNASLAQYPPVIHYIVTFFMFLAGINFALHYFALRGGISKVFRNEELRLYLLIILVVTFTISLILINHGGGVEKSIRDSLFQVVTIITCTGFATTDYLLWPEHAWMLIFFVMFVGGCAGSTAGGIKVIRHLIVFKTIRNYIARLLNPNRVILLKYNNSVVDQTSANGITSYFFMYLFTFVIGSVVMIFTGLDLHSAMGSVITTLGGIGPGLGIVGPTGNFHEVTIFGKYFLCLMMLLGRLEFYSLLIILMPGFWKL